MNVTPSNSAISTTTQHGARKKRSVGTPSTFWEAGQALRISFFDEADDALKGAILEVAKTWLEFANLEFELVANHDDSADIRINTDVDSKLNTAPLGRTTEGEPGPNMLLGCKPGEQDFQKDVLQLFGTALGLRNEHQHPDANFDWNLDGLRSFLKNHLEFDEELEDGAQVLEAIIESNFMPLQEEGLITLEYDPSSVMHYKIEPEWTLDGRSSAMNTQLSAKDKQLVAMIYPGR